MRAATRNPFHRPFAPLTPNPETPSRSAAFRSLFLRLPRAALPPVVDEYNFGQRDVPILALQLCGAREGQFATCRLRGVRRISEAEYWQTRERVTSDHTLLCQAPAVPVHDQPLAFGHAIYQFVHAPLVQPGDPNSPPPFAGAHDVFAMPDWARSPFFGDAGGAQELVSEG